MKKLKSFFLIIVICLGCVLTSCTVAELKSETPTISNTPQEREATPTFQENQEENRIRLTDGMKLVFVPGGDFLMGSTEPEIKAAIALCKQHYSPCNRWYYERESPQHLVSVDDYWLDQTEVSNDQYRLCTEAGICTQPTTCKKGEPTFDDPERADHPVVCVDWDDAQAYCQWVGGRLPTEAEWEYAFRGADGLIFPWGDAFDGSKLNYCDQNCSQSHADDRFGDGYSLTAPVGSYPSGISWSGAYNMGGNVSEWVEDWFGDYSPDTLSNPSGPESGSEKMLKGCSWFFHPTYCRGALRASVDPDTRFDYLGFRCASSDSIIALETDTPISAEITTVPDMNPVKTQIPPISNSDELVFVNSSQIFGLDRSWDIALGDLDGDEDLDAIITNDNAEGMKIWFNNGKGIYECGEQKFNPSFNVVLGDLDNDLDLDIVATNWDIEADEWINGFADATVWLNDGTGDFTKKQEALGDDRVFNLALGDLNSDGYLDIFLTTIGANTVWLNDGTGHIVDTFQSLETGIDQAVSLGDLDGDGDLDALTGGWDGPPKVWLNNGAAVFTLYQQNITKTNLHIHGLSLGDLDGDGDLDAFSVFANGDSHEVWFNNGSGLFEPNQTLSAPLAHGVELVDIDHDGDLDSVTAHGYQSGGYVKVWLNNGEGSFIDSQLKLGNTFSSAIALGDLDQDGDLDIFATHTHWQPESQGEPDMIWLNQSKHLLEQKPEEGVDMIAPIVIPSGNHPTLDGTHSPGEWDDAAVDIFADGSQIFLMQDGEFLYVGIRANEPGTIAGNIFIQHGDEIHILHSSAALGTAIYQKGDENWQQIQDFTWRCRSTSNSESAQAERAEFLAEEGWLAANGRMGTANELEYQIKIPEGDFRLAAVYIKATTPYEKIPWPPQLIDDTITPTPGGLPDSFYFSPEQWIVLDLLK